MVQLGQYPSAQHVIAHISDTHFLGGGRALYGKVDVAKHLTEALAQLERADAQPEAIVFTGDLADLGEPDAYTRLRKIVEPVAARLGAQIIWVMGNHDERIQYSQQLFDNEGSDEPQDRVYDIGGLRLIVLDSSVPGFHHGDLTDQQLAWLSKELEKPATHGTLLALHHPPIPTPLLEAMGMLELHDQDRLERVIKGTDVRGILAGHLHYTTHSTFAGIPVSVAAATCYTLDLSAGDRILSGVDHGQAFNMVHVYEDRIVHSVIPVGTTEEVTGFSGENWPVIEGMTPAQRLAAFSSKSSDFNSAEAASSN
ncbi:MAG: phosphodiesterase [Cryobacterium sp.]|nr:phosphodiesterase [Cryobacterium sp.]